MIKENMAWKLGSDDIFKDIYPMPVPSSTSSLTFINRIFRVVFTCFMALSLSVSVQAQTKPNTSTPIDKDKPCTSTKDKPCSSDGEPNTPNRVVGGGGDENNTPIPDWHKRQDIEQRLSPFSPNLMGDQIDPHTGSIVFEQTDVSLPGNFALPVAISRVRSQGAPYHEDTHIEFGDWELQVPKISAFTMSNWKSPTYNRCSQSFANGFLTEVTFNGD